MKLELKRISLWATVKVSFFLSLIVGFVAGCFYIPLFAMMAALPSPAFERQGLEGITDVFWVLAFLMPFIFSIGSAIINTIFAFIGAVSYNLIAKIVGGYEFEFTVVSDAADAAHRPVVIPATVSHQSENLRPSAPSTRTDISDRDEPRGSSSDYQI